jgi:ABC-type nitrate/sulfonate/bicarbonate transport system substrate-binding protein
MHKKRYTIGGVPEHFNMPWQIAIERNIFDEKNIEVIWREYPAGTGAMMQALDNNEIDIAIALTEGVVHNIKQCRNNTILAKYVNSPLIWGIHTRYNATEKSISEFKNPQFAISRKGSGSHLMALIHAQEDKRKINEVQFTTIHNLSNAIDSITRGETDIFYWEKFTTQTWVDKQIFKRIGEYPSPWNAFVYVSKNETALIHQQDFEYLIQTIANLAQVLRSNNEYANQIVERYNLEIKNVIKWLDTVEWSNGEKLSKEEFAFVANKLNLIE